VETIKLDTPDGVEEATQLICRPADPAR